MKKETRKINAPCYKCEDRTSICHAICERYKKYEKERAEARRNRDDSYIYHNYYFSPARLKRFDKK